MQRNYRIAFIQMANTKQDPLPLPDGYAELLMGHIEKLGKDRIAKLAKIDRGTLWRNVSQGQLTLTTIRKVRKAIEKAYVEQGDIAPAIPPPITTVVNAKHLAFCRLGERLMEHPEVFDAVVTYALDELHKADTDVLLVEAEESLRNPK